MIIFHPGLRVGLGTVELFKRLSAPPHLKINPYSVGEVRTARPEVRPLFRFTVLGRTDR